MKRVVLFTIVALLLAAGFGLAGNTLIGADPAVAVTLQQVESQDADSLDVVTSSAFSYQGYLEEGGSPVTGPVSLIVRLYSNWACTNQVGPDIPRNVNADNGRFHMRVPVGEGIFNGQKLFLRIVVGGTAIGCRQILAAPYALSLRPGAVISGSVDYGGDYGGAVIAALNDSGHAIYGERQASGAGSAGYFINRGSTDGVHAQSAQGDGVYGIGGDGTYDYGGRFAGWGGITTYANSGPGVLVNDAGGIANTYAQNPGDVVASDDLIADNNLGLGAPGVHGGMYVRDGADEVMLEFTSSNALLTLGGTGDDGDLYVHNNADARTFRVDGDTGEVWGNESGNTTDLKLMSNDDVHVYLEQTNPVSSSGVFYIRDNAGNAVFYVTETGNLWAKGQLAAAGGKPAVVNTEDYGKRLVYAMESPELWFEDFGSGKLTDGAAVIRFEPIFAETVNTAVPYQVYLTPEGGWAGLYVTDKTPTSFTVRAEGGNPNVAFDYRIVAKRLGYEDARLEQFTEDADEGDGDEAAVIPAGSAEAEVTLRNVEEELGRRDPNLESAPAEEAQN